MHQPARDLFGEVPVTEDDLVAWVAAVAPRWLATERAFTNYCRSWDVPGKIRAAKQAGTFDERVKKPGSFWHARLALAAIL